MGWCGGYVACPRQITHTQSPFSPHAHHVLYPGRASLNFSDGGGGLEQPNSGGAGSMGSVGDEGEGNGADKAEVGGEGQGNGAGEGEKRAAEGENREGQGAGNAQESELEIAEDRRRCESPRRFREVL